MKISTLCCTFCLLAKLAFAEDNNMSEENINGIKDITVLAKDNNIHYQEDTKQREWLNWFNKENLAIRGSFFGSKLSRQTESFLDMDYDLEYGHPRGVGVNDPTDEFKLDGDYDLGSEFGFGYKIGRGVEFGFSYVFMKIDDLEGTVTTVDPGYDNPNWYYTINMDIDSSAIMFNGRVYLNELTGWGMGRFSPYLLGSIGRATHEVTDHYRQDMPSKNDNDDNNVTHSQDSNKNVDTAYRVGVGTLFKLSKHISMDLSTSFMDLGKARTSRYGEHEVGGSTIMQQPIEPDMRSMQGTIGFQFNF